MAGQAPVGIGVLRVCRPTGADSYDRNVAGNTRMGTTRRIVTLGINAAYSYVRRDDATLKGETTMIRILSLVVAATTIVTAASAVESVYDAPEYARIEQRVSLDYAFGEDAPVSVVTMPEMVIEGDVPSVNGVAKSWECGDWRDLDAVQAVRTCEWR